MFIHGKQLLWSRDLPEDVPARLKPSCMKIKPMSFHYNCSTVAVVLVHISHKTRVFPFLKYENLYSKCRKFRNQDIYISKTSIETKESK